MFRLHAKRVLFPLAVTLTPILASAAGCDWVDKVDHVSVPSPDGGDAGANGIARFRLAAGATTPPALLDVPFPSDVYLGSNGRIGPIGGIDAVIPSQGGAAFIANDLQANNGFSRVAMSLFYVDDSSSTVDGQPAAAEIDKASLPATEADCKGDASSVFLVDLEASDAAQARIGCRAAFHTNERAGTRSSIAVGPARGTVLKEGHKYAAVLTNRVKLASGNALTTSPDFDRIRKGDRAGLAKIYGEAYDKAKSVLGSALGSAEIVALAPFTTNSMADELFKLREAIDATPAPTLAWTQQATGPLSAARFGGTGAAEGWTATLDEYLGTVADANKLPAPFSQDNPSTHLPVRAHDKLASISTAAFEAVSFLQAKSGGYTTPGHATFARKADGTLDTSVSSKARIWVTVAIPNAEMPADGWPVVIVQHGLNSSRDYMFALANSFAARGFATVAIDSITFGARGVAPTALKDVTSSYFGTKDNNATWGCPASDTSCNKGDGLLDGSQPGSTALFGGLINIGALRDQMRQAALDTTQLVRALRGIPAAGITELKRASDAAAPKLDTTKIAYVGDSLGAIQGATAAAIEPNIKNWVLNVGGGGLLVELATHSPRIFELLKAAAGINFGFTDDKLSESHPLITLLQTIADAGDPLNYADLLIKSPRSVGGTPVPPRNILQLEVLYDEVVPNEANEALARAGGWGLAAPNAGSNAGISNVKTLTGRNDQLLPNIAATEGVISKNMTEGVTAVVVQSSPSQHSSNLVSAATRRTYEAPFARFDTSDPFPKSSAAGAEGYLITLAPQYLQLQSTVATFLADGFKGDVPRVVTDPAKGGFPAPVRDIDGDKLPDDTDPEPNVPASK
ncbi:hypothetical protein LZC95_07215 [Pendulispora brunnea]|uniref:Uncharacterized protein n=1 Tax=Pendulispora brunnea TaxID=2905690 RepID=A0ABZ2KH24_9BACT